MRWDVVVRALISMALVLVGCGGRPPLTTGSPNDDHWETTNDQRFVVDQPCATGPFEVRFPARAVAWGRRLTVEVHGERRVPLHYDIGIVSEDGSVRTLFVSALPEPFETDERCGPARGVVVEGAPADGTTGGEATGIRVPLGSLEEEGSELPLAPPVALTPFVGELPPAQTGEGYALYPHGVPHRRWEAGLQGDSSGGHHERAELVVRIRVWALAPVDFDRVVLRFRDQTLVPDLAASEYEARFAERVRWSDRSSAARRAQQRVMGRSQRAYCALQRCVAPLPGPPDRPPPQPLAETPPPAPGGDVEWIPGFWSYDASAVAYVWVGGTFVSRAAAPRTQPVEVAPPVREIEATVPPRPAPRAEVVPAPDVAGSVWVAGHWHLEADTWSWVEGRWTLPPSVGARPIAPSVETRGAIRVYLPGGWLEIR